MSIQTRFRILTLFSILLFISGSNAATYDFVDTDITYPSASGHTLNLSGKTDLHFTSATPITGCTINLNSEDSWLFFDSVKPTSVSSYLSQIKVNGANAVNGSTVIVRQNVNGSVIIPYPSSLNPLKIYSAHYCSGSVANIKATYQYYKDSDLGPFQDNISSFTLKRGYMVTFAANSDGTGASKVYIAQDDDIVVNVMPEGLDNSISFMRLFPWREVGKKGWCGNSSSQYNALNCAWYYDWDNALTSSSNIEYVPMRHNANWNSYSNINNNTGATAVLAFNEPNSSDQSDMTVDEALAQWPNFLASGLRIGTPAPTDGGKAWLYEFCAKAKELNYRVDFVAIHFYQANKSASDLYTWLKDIHDNTGLPIWVTEFNNGANWTAGPPTLAENAADIKAFIEMMDRAPFIERYAIYNWVEAERYMINDDGSLTPAGEYYKANNSPTALGEYMPGGTPGCAYYKFDNNTRDSLVYRNDATAMRGMDTTAASMFSTGRDGQAIDLGGTTTNGLYRYLEVPQELGNCKDFSFAGWFYVRSTSSWQRIFDFGNDHSNYMFLTPRSPSNTLRFAIQTSTSGGEQRVETSSPSANQWVHIAFTLKDNTGTIYVNGQQAAASSSITLNPEDLRTIHNYLGRSQFVNDALFDGLMDDVRIANYALSSSEITALYNGSTTGFAPGITQSPYQSELGDINSSYSKSLIREIGDIDAQSAPEVSITSGPEWLSADSAGTLTGTPGFENYGNNTFNISISDSDENSTDTTFNVPVNKYSLLHHYKFDGNLDGNLVPGSDAVAASSGDLAFSTGVIGQAASFDGTDDYVQLPDGITNYDELSISFYIFWRGGSSWQRIFDFGGGTSSYMMLTPASSGGTMRLAITNSGYSAESRIETSSLTANSVKHVTLTFSGTVGKLYIDGTMVASNTSLATTPKDLLSTQNYIGKSQFSSDPMLYGIVDDFRIYNYCLTDDDVANSCPETDK